MLSGHVGWKEKIGQKQMIRSLPAYLRRDEVKKEGGGT